MGAEGCSHFDTQATNSHLPAIHSFRAESMRVRHSRVQLAVTPSSEEAEETKSWLPSLPQFKLASHNKGDSDDNWSLVDLLSRSNSAKSQAPSTTRFAVTPIPKLRLLNKKNSPASAILSGGATATRARHWRRPSFSATNGESLTESVDMDFDMDGSEFCRASSGSSISWAEDAVEAEQSKALANLWNEIETVCATGDRPLEMSDAVYEECLLWRRAFPHESASYSNRFESMEEYQNEIEDQDLVSTPTNELMSFQFNSSHESDSSRTIRQISDPENSARNEAGKTDFVAAWLSQCQLNSSDSEDELIPSRPSSYSQEFKRKSSSFNFKPKSSDKMKREKWMNETDTEIRSESVSSPWDSARTPTSTFTHPLMKQESPIGMRLKSSSSDEDPENTGMDMDKLQDLSTSSYLTPRPRTLHVPIEDKFRGRRNSEKPFLLWVLDRNSPSE